MTDAAGWRMAEAKAAFNGAWDLIDLDERSADQQREMVVRAAASRYLWAGTDDPDLESKLAIADWQVAHALSWIGDGSLALLFATAAYDRVRANGWTDWRLASVEEGMARAHGVLGDRDERDRHVEAAWALLDGLDDEDRQIIEGQLATVP
jgi:hypothetical protein